MYKILPSITTLKESDSTWQSKIEEIEMLNLKQVALFLTGLAADERQECYKKLLQAKQKHSFAIPFVHSVSDMSESEYMFLIQNFETQKFNLHPVREFPLRHALSEQIKKQIYIENSTSDLMLESNDFAGFGGICFDLTHLDDLRRRNKQGYEQILELTKNFHVGANHISAVGYNYDPLSNKLAYSSKHVLLNPNELNYLAKISAKAHSEMLAIELENSLKTQVSLISKIYTELEKARNGEEFLAA